MESVIQFPAQAQGEAHEGAKQIGELPIPLCNVQEFAEITGVSDQTVRRCIREGQIPAMRIGRRLIIRTDKLLEQGA